MKKLQLFTVLLFIGFLTSCSKDSTTSNGTPITTVVLGPNTLNFSKNVLIEDYTGTWCGWCPRVSYGISQVEAQTTKGAYVAIHRAGNDPFIWSGSDVLANMLGVNSYPTAKLNRKTDWNYPEDSNINQPIDLTGVNAGLGLAMNSNFTNNTLNLNVNVKFGNSYTNLKLIVYVLENNLINEQTNYTTHYGGNGNQVIPNFKHDHVLRTSLTNILGEPIPADQIVVGQTFTKNYAVSLPSINVSESQNMSFVAFIVGSDGKVINCRAANLNENQTIEMIN